MTKEETWAKAYQDALKHKHIFFTVDGVQYFDTEKVTELVQEQRLEQKELSNETK